MRPSRAEVLRLAVLALVGTCVVAGTLFALNWRVNHDVVNLISPGDQGPVGSSSVSGA